MKIQNSDSLKQALKAFEKAQNNGDLVETAVNQMAEKRNFEANSKTVKAIDEMLGTIIDIKK